MGRIFLLEIMVHNIEFEEIIQPIPRAAELKISITFSDVIKTEMVLADYPGDTFTVIDHNRALGLNMGKTIVFDYNITALANNLKKFPMEFVLRKNKSQIGAGQLVWKEDFVNMVNLFESVGVVKAVDFCGGIDLTNMDGIKTARLNLFKRFTCFGERTICDVVLPRTDRREITVANRTTERIMSCEGTSIDKLDFFMNTCFYKPAVCYLSCDVFYICARRDVPIIPMGDEEPTNLFELFGQQSNLDVISVSFRHSDTRLYDFLSAISEIPKDDRADRSFYVEEEPVEIDKQQEVSTKIQRAQFCHNETCEGNIKFKEYGFGYRGKPHLEPLSPITLSHANGSVQNYGPDSKFSRPKKADLPFVPPRDVIEDDTDSGKKSTQFRSKERKSNKKFQDCGCQRLRCGSETKS